MPVSDYDSASFVGRNDIVDEVIRRALTTPALIRSLLIEGPANRGKSWVLCRTHEKLIDPAAVASIIPNSPPVAICLYSSDDARPFEPLRLVASVWWALHPYFPSLFWPTGLPDTTIKDTAIQALHSFFRQNNFDAQSLLSVATQDLDTASPPILLVLLVDGLDEFDQLDAFERQFVEPLFRSPNVRVVASRRSHVHTARWTTFSLRPKKDGSINLDRLNAHDAEDQITRHFGRCGSPLTYAELNASIKHYAWQNPGANRRFADCAIEKQVTQRLITSDNVRSCLLQLSTSGRFSNPISDNDFDWLTAVVKHFPSIGSSEVPAHALNAVLEATAQRPVGDFERNEWLGRLQDRAIVMRRNSGQCLVHDEFAALCQEWEAQRTL